VSNPETRLQQSIIRHLQSEVGGWWVKYHGSAITRAGIPDILGGCEGLFFAFEVKTSTGKTTKIQDYTLKELNDSGAGIARVVDNPKNAVAIVHTALTNRRQHD